MVHINHDGLQPGMKLARKVEDRQGRLLMAAGTELTDRHIRSLRLWGITAVDVEGDEPENTSKSEIAAPLSAETVETAKALTAKAFCHNMSHRNHPFIRQVTVIYFSRLVRQLQKDKTVADKVLMLNQSNPPLTPTALPSGNARRKRPTLDEFVRGTKTIMSLPAVYNEIVRVVNDPRSSATDVANIISGDTGLTARLLRLVNSAFYGFPGKVDTVTRAITLVGLSQLCELALATSVMGVSSKGAGSHIDLPAFWKHSLCCGVVTRLLAEHKHETNPERYFVTGLLHDIGRLVILTQLPDLALEAIRAAQTTRQPLSAMEDAHIGFTHADVGRALLENWNLPPSQRQAVFRHHRPLEGGEYVTEVAATHLADVIAHVMGTGLNGELALPPFQPQAWDHLALAPEILPALIDEADMQVKDLAGIFDLEERR